MFLNPCIQKIYSVSTVVGGANCNASCAHCGGKNLDLTNADPDRVVWSTVQASRLALSYGGWTLSLTGSGEPLLYSDHITQVLLELNIDGCRWPFVNLFTNGSLLQKASDDGLLSKWKEYGLTSVVVSRHSIHDGKNNAVYGCRIPSVSYINKLVRAHGLSLRTVLLLGNGSIDTCEGFIDALSAMRESGVRMVTAWPISNNDGSRCDATISRIELAKIRWWLYRNTKLVMGHVWGGQVRALGDLQVRLTDYVSEHKPSNDFIRQLVVLPDGSVSYSWYQPGMICLY